MSFSRVQPTGWVSLQRLLHTEMNTIDLNLSRALDGYGGGPNTLTAELTLNSDAPLTKGVTFDCRTIFNGPQSFTGVATFTEDATFSEDVTLGSSVADALTVNATAGFVNPVTFSSTSTFTGAAAFNGNVTLGNASGDVITVTGTATFAQATTFSSGGTLSGTWAGTPTFSGAVTLNSTLVVQGISTFNAGASFTANVVLGDSSADFVLLNGIMVNTGSGRTRKRVVFTADVDGTTYGINDGDIFVAENGTITTNRSYVLSTTGAGTGDEIEFKNRSTLNTITVGGTTLQASGAGNIRGVKFLFSGGAWNLHCVYRDN